MTDERSELYLILHKVRGEPAFDIATKLQIGDEEGWIIPTSGHRAYPWFHQPLHEIVQDDLMAIASLPDEVPDHYPSKSVDDRPKFTLESLGLTKAKPNHGLKRP